MWDNFHGMSNWGGKYEILWLYLLLPVILSVTQKLAFASWWMSKEAAKPKLRKIYYFLQQVRRTSRIFPKAVSTQQQELGNFKPKGTCILWRGLSRGKFQHRLRGKGQQNPSFSWLRSGESVSSFHPLPGWEPLSSCRTKDMLSCAFLEGGLEHCLITALLFDRLFCVPLRSWITETCSRASVGLRSQNSWGYSGSSYVKKAIHPGCLSLGTP